MTNGSRGMSWEHLFWTVSWLPMKKFLFNYVSLLKLQNMQTALEIASLIHFWYTWEGKASLSSSHEQDKLNSSSCRF